MNAGGAVTCHRNSSGAHTRASTVSIDAKPRGAVLQPARDFSPPGSVGRLTPRRGLEFAVLELFHAVNLASLPATRSRHFGRWRRAEDRRGDTDRAVYGRPSMCCTVFRRSPARTSRRRKRMWISRGGGKDWRNRTTRVDMAASKAQDNRRIVRSSGDVFADLGLAGAGERQAKVQLAVAINELHRRQGASQVKAAELLHINRPKVSALSKYRLQGFSVERLMRFLTLLNQDIEIVIRSRPRARRPGRVSVTAASGFRTRSAGESHQSP